MTLLVVAHGTRDPAGALVSSRLAASVAERVPVPVELAYAGVRGPSVASVLRRVAGPVVVAPAFLAAGYHVRVDVPGQIVASGRDDVRLAAPPSVSAMVSAVVDRLLEAGFRSSDDVVLAAAGSSDSAAVADVRRAAGLLSGLVGRPVRIGCIGAGSPTVAEAVAGCDGRVAVASWLLAPGVFHSRLARCGAAVVSAPVGVHSALVRELVSRAFVRVGNQQ
jgi:sirohydrochlorin ferrochelatase